jgi:hypothetical protein
MGWRKALEIGGVLAAIVLFAFGIAAIVIGLDGRSTVKDELTAQMITGTPDMTPTNITAAVKEAGLDPAKIPIPSCSVAGQLVDTGGEARCFAQYMNVHALESTGGLVYSQMPRYASPDGKGTNDPKAAVQVNGKPQDNAARNIWVTETALATALNASYMADQTALFGVVVGIALLIAGLGFAILAIGGALRNPESIFNRKKKEAPAEAAATGGAAPTT